ncbi:DUF2149 domain-containing protein [Neptunomonas phycophila]|uniref:DUF2149 domain-containing protein n=1 Tax=Neptunomonas phycophila TaxID=1572645 RepID=UPI0037366481
MSRGWNRGRFDQGDNEPLGPMSNLVDLMLVFACGLIAALIALSDQLQAHFNPQDKTQQTITSGKELPNLPTGSANGAAGYESVGQVYRDPKTGQLILIGE